MSAYIVAVVVQAGKPDVPPEVSFYAANAGTREEAEKLIREKLKGIDLVAVGVCAAPRSLPTKDGEVAYI